MKALLLAWALLSCGLARADAVTQWTDIGLKAARTSSTSADAAQALAGMHMAMLEAMNFIEGRYVPRFSVRLRAPLSGSSEVAGVSGAHWYLTLLYPDQTEMLDKALDASLAGMAEVDSKASLVIIGRTIGENVYALLRKQSLSRAAGTPGSDLLDSYATAAKLVEARRLAPIESARLLALVAIALSDMPPAQKRNADLVAQAIVQPSARARPPAGANEALRYYAPAR